MIRVGDNIIQFSALLDTYSHESSEVASSLCGLGLDMLDYAKSMVKGANASLARSYRSSFVHVASKHTPELPRCGRGTRGAMARRAERLMLGTLWVPRTRGTGSTDQRLVVQDGMSEFVYNYHSFIYSYSFLI